MLGCNSQIRNNLNSNLRSVLLKTKYKRIIITTVDDNFQDINDYGSYPEYARNPEYVIVF